jgi:hypothetical protein
VTSFAWDGLAWLVASLVLFVVVQRWLHRELQSIFLLLTHHPRLTIGLFSLLFLPGVVLHESSHWLMARLLRVRTGRFSVIPALMPNGVLRMGYIETAQSDPARDALIGTAPLVSGAVVIALIGLHRLGMAPLAEAFARGQWAAVWAALPALPSLPDFWLWFYLAFAVSSTMLPSASDRRSWLPVALVAGIVAVVALLAGAGPWMAANLAPAANRWLMALALIFVLSLGLHALLALPAFGLRLLISRVTGYQVA